MSPSESTGATGKYPPLIPGRWPALPSSNLRLLLHAASSESISKLAPCISLRQRTESKMKNSGSGPKYAVSATPEDFRYASARLPIERGQRVYACIVDGSSTSQVRISVGTAANGSSTALPGSGISTMSESLIPFHPEIDEPSNILPSSNNASSTALAGKVTWCCNPRMSAKRKSTNSTALSLISFSTFFTMREPRIVAAGEEAEGAPDASRYDCRPLSALQKKNGDMPAMRLL